MIFLMRTDYRWLRTISPLLMLAALAGLAAVLVPDVGVNRYGATRWIALGPLPPVQPSEFAKLALDHLRLRLALQQEPQPAAASPPASCRSSLWSVSWPGLIMLEPDMGTTIIIVLTTITLFFVAGGALSHLLALISIGGVTRESSFVLSGGYRMDRIFAFVSPEADPSGRGFHILQLLIALGSGGVTGLGVGASRQKFFYVPGAHTDGVFAIIGEEMGFIGGPGRRPALRPARLSRHPRDGRTHPTTSGLAAGTRRHELDRLPDAHQYRRHHPLDPADRASRCPS